MAADLADDGPVVIVVVRCDPVDRSPNVAPQSRAIGLVVWLMGMGLGAANETLEFLASLVMADSRVGGYENTGWDLVSNLVGSGAVAGWLQRRHRTTNRQPEPR